VARRLPASNALAKIIIVRPLMTFSIWLGGVPPQDRFQTLFFCKVTANVAMKGRWECLFVVSTKISFNQTELMQPGRMRASSRRDRSVEWVCRNFNSRKLDGAHRPHEGDEVRRAPSTRQPHDLASGDRRGCTGSDLGLQD
jgi:hypothetical protein